MKTEKLITARAAIQEMSLSEVVSRIGESRWREVGECDARPMFVELVAGHEGVSKGRLGPAPGKGKPADKRWTPKAVRQLIEKLGAGAPLYLFHHRGGKREEVGRVLSAGEGRVDGLVSANAVAWVKDPAVKDRIRSGEIDTCSVEAEIECSRENNTASWLVDRVLKVTGLALGSTRFERPGFQKAALTAAVEEFDDPEPTPKKEEEEGVDVPPEKETPSFPSLSDLENTVREVVRQELAGLRESAGKNGSSRIATPPEPAAKKPKNPLIPD